MLRKAKEVIIKNQIRHVICSGGPFGVMYHITKLRKWFPDIFILNDLRDPWTWGPNWGFPDLPPKRMAYELSLEARAIEQSDLFSVPSHDMCDYLKKHYPDLKDKIIHIPHFFDPAEAICLPKTKSDKIRLIMYGNIYHNIQPYIDALASLMHQYKDHILLDIYTDKQHHKKTFLKYQADNVRFLDQVDAEVLFSKFENYDYVFLFNPSYNINNISTKFFEIISTKTPIILFCEKGNGSDFIVNNRLGLHADFHNVGELFGSLAAGTLDFSYNSNYNIDDFSLSNITDRISEILTRNQSFTTPRSDNKILKNVLITFDYEMFLGSKSGTVDNCIIKPTNMIIALLEKQHIKKALFFIDTSYIMRLCAQDNSKTREDYRKIEEQLCTLLKKDHLLLPHIHPHWLDAVYINDTNQWELSDTSKYRFHNINEEKRNELFDFSISFIKKVQGIAKIYYDISGYRAGGFCLQPFKDFLPLLKKYHIENEFSVLKNFRNLSETFYYDYTKVPRREIYHFNEHVEIQEYKGHFKQFSISHIEVKHRLINRLLLKYLSLTGNRRFGDGLSVNKPEELIVKKNVFGKEDKIPVNYEMASVDLINMYKFYAYKSLVDHNPYIHFISHPKMLSSHNIKCFGRLLSHIRKNYAIETDFEKMN